MTEREPEQPIPMHAPVPEVPPMPASTERNVGVAVVAILGGLSLLAVVVVDSLGHLHGWDRLLYAIPAALLGAAGWLLVRETETTDRG
jgi:hypothetical protein